MSDNSFTIEDYLKEPEMGFSDKRPKQCWPGCPCC